MQDYPNDYTDSFYSDLTDAAEERHDLPSGMLHSLYMEGEKSNANASNSKGTKFPWQVTKQMRDAFLEKEGIDAHLNPQNAVEVAARIAKDGLKKYDGNVDLAIAHYGGWDNVDNSYVKRVDSAFKDGKYNKFKGAYDAYQSGMMDEEESKNFENLVNNGEIKLAPNWKLKESNLVNQDVVDAYHNNVMSPEDKEAFETAVKSGKISLPQGVSLAAPAEASEMPVESKNQDGQPIPQDSYENLASDLTGTPEAPVFTGEPATIKPFRNGSLPSVWDMPEMNQMPNMMGPEAGLEGLGPGEDYKNANDNALKSLKSKYGSLMASPEETMKILKVNFPNVDIQKDESGNFVVKSGMDGKQYVFSPEKIQSGDFERFALSSIPFMMGGEIGAAPGALNLVKQAVTAGATQAGLETGNALSGGSFDPENVAVSAAIPVGLRAGTKVLTPAEDSNVGKLIDSMTMSDYGKLALDAFKNDEKGLAARKQLAAFFQGDSEIQTAAKNLNLEDLPPDILTANKEARELAAITRTDKGSESANKFLGSTDTDGTVQKVSGAAKTALEENYGATDNVVELNRRVKKGLESQRDSLRALERVEYPNTAPADFNKRPDNLIEYIQKRLSKNNGDISNLTPLEQKIWSKLNPKVTKESVPASSILDSRGNPLIPEGESVTVTNPTYDMLESELKDLRKSRYDQSHPFNSTDDFVRNNLEEALAKDQLSFVKSGGGEEGLTALERAHNYTKQRKNVEEQLQNLFGRDVENSMVTKIKDLVTKAGTGDLETLQKTVNSLPERNRSEVLATAIKRSLIGDDAKSMQKFIDFHENLDKNPELKKFFTDTLGEGSEQTFKDINTMFSSIKRSANLIKESKGAINELNDTVKAPSNRVGLLASTAGRIGSLLMYRGMNAPVSASSISGFVHRLLSGSETGKAELAHMLASSHFQDLIKESVLNKTVPNKVVGSLAISKPFNDYAKVNPDIPKSLPDRIKYINSIVQASKPNIKSDENQKD